MKQLPPGATLTELTAKFAAERTQVLLSEGKEIEDLRAVQAA